MATHRLSAAALLWALVLGTAVPANAQDSAGPGGSADPLTTFDMRIIDAQGQVLTSLTPADVLVEVDGEPRSIADVRYVAFDETTSTGRVLLLVVDDDSFVGPLPAQVIDAVSRWAGTLVPGDRLGFLTTSGRVDAVDASRDRGAVIAALRAVIGSVHRPGLPATAMIRTGLDRINVIQAGVRRLLLSPGTRAAVILTAGALEGADDEAVQSLRRTAEQTGAALFGVSLAGRDADGDAVADGAAGRPSTGAAGGRVDTLTAAGGRWLGEGNLTTAFAEMDRQLSGTFRVTLTPSALASEGPFQYLFVRPNDTSWTVQAPTRLLTPGVTLKPELIADRVELLLRDGEPAEGVLVSNAIVVARDEEPGSVRLLNTVSVSDPARAPMSMTFVVLDMDGREVRGGAGRLVEPIQGELRTSFAASVPPGRYRVRVAVADAEGRLGTSDDAVLAEYHAWGTMTAADPQVVWRQGTSPWYLVSGHTVPTAADALAIGIELMDGAGRAASDPPAVKVVLTSAAGRDVAEQPLTPVATASGWRVSGEVALESLPAGRYDVTLTIADRDRPEGVVGTWIRRGAAPRSSRPTRVSTAEFLDLFQADVRAMWPRFDPASTLTTGVARRLLQDLALDLGRPMPASIADGVDPADYGAALVRLAAGSDPFGALARAIFALVRGDADAADSALADVRRAAPDAAALALMVGASHAAAGRDREAVAAWREAIGTSAVGSPGTELEFAL